MHFPGRRLSYNTIRTKAVSDRPPVRLTFFSASFVKE